MGAIESTNAKATLPTNKKTKITPKGPDVERSWLKPKKRPVPITPAIWGELANNFLLDLIIGGIHTANLVMNMTKRKRI